MRGDTRPVISMITPVIYLANAEAARSQNIISEFRIKRIISVTNDPDYRPSAEFLKKYGVEQRIFPIEDMEFHGRDSLRARVSPHCGAPAGCHGIIFFLLNKRIQVVVRVHLPLEAGPGMVQAPHLKKCRVFSRLFIVEQTGTTAVRG